MKAWGFVIRLVMFSLVATTLVCSDTEKIVDNGDGDPPGPCDNQTIQADTLIADPAWDGEPAWSPNCAEIAFTSQRSGDYEIHVKKLSDGSTRQLTTAGGGDASWSPNGGLIAFDNNGYIYVVPAAGGAKTVKTKGWNPAWSPDGTQIAFVRLIVPDTRELWVINADLSDSTLVVRLVGDVFICCPTWSKDGAEVAVTRERTGINPYNDIWAFNVTSKIGREVSAGTAPVEDWQPDWSPDGSEILFSRNGNIYVMPAVGETVANPAVQITCFDPGVVGENDAPTWSPDGKWIAYESEGSGNVIIVRRVACSGP